MLEKSLGTTEEEPQEIQVETVIKCNRMDVFDTPEAALIASGVNWADWMDALDDFESVTSV